MDRLLGHMNWKLHVSVHTRTVLIVYSVHVEAEVTPPKCFIGRDGDL